ncbi:MAG: hypothetical protein EBY16_02420 [Gammaproteobacteria bacterium]|nr:hypothetical protein [Gammaproteobacteria bacterium]
MIFNRNYLAQFDTIIRAINFLKREGIYNEHHLNLVADNTYSLDLAHVLRDLKCADILDTKNCNVVAEHPNLSELSNPLRILHAAAILNRSNFDALVAPNHASLISNEANQYVWSRLPLVHITQDNYHRLLNAAEHANPIYEIRRISNLILGIVPAYALAGAGGRAPVFNSTQSTHTRSVLATVSISASILLKTYGENFELKSKIEEMKIYVNGLNDTPKHRAALNCIIRFTTDVAMFTNLFGISNLQLLALAYTAIHDDDKRIGDLENAKYLIVQGLYEIQRGLNLDERGKDRGGDDLPICAEGTFNKIIEKLIGIHADVQINFITHQGACNKFPILVQAHAQNYLQSIASPKTAIDYQAVNALIAKMKMDGNLVSIWGNINERIKNELWDEFHEAYADDPTHQKFRELIACGKEDVAAPDLCSIEEQLLASPGFLANKELLSMHQHSLWSTTDPSRSVQKMTKQAQINPSI